MEKLSKRHRKDELLGISSDLRTLLDNEYLHKQDNLSAQNPKLLVAFSGTSAVGKSTLSKRIEEELNGLVIENDGVKRCLIEHRPELSQRERGKVTWEYTMDLFRRLPEVTPNGLIVRDAVIDWYFDRIFPIFEASGYKIFIVKFDVSKDKNVDLLKSRGDTETQSLENLLDVLPEQHIHMTRFAESYKPDITLTDDNLYDHKAVVEKLRKTLNELK